MKHIIFAIVLTLCSPFASAMTCVDEGQNKYFIEPYGDSAILLNEMPFHEIRVEEFNDPDTNIHSTWLQDSNGAIVLISVVTNKNSNNASTKLHVIEGSEMSIGICD